MNHQNVQVCCVLCAVRCASPAACRCEHLPVALRARWLPRALLRAAPGLYVPPVPPSECMCHMFCSFLQSLSVLRGCRCLAIGRRWFGRRLSRFRSCTRRGAAACVAGRSRRASPSRGLLTCLTPAAPPGTPLRTSACRTNDMSLAGVATDFAVVQSFTNRAPDHHRRPPSGRRGCRRCGAPRCRPSWPGLKACAWSCSAW